MIDERLNEIYFTCGAIGFIAGVTGSFIYDAITLIFSRKNKNEPKNVIVHINKDE